LSDYRDLSKEEVHTILLRLVKGNVMETVGVRLVLEVLRHDPDLVQYLAEQSYKCMAIDMETMERLGKKMAVDLRTIVEEVILAGDMGINTIETVSGRSSWTIGQD
jgi:hypothetical protein